jgi:hypothetical protein
MFSKKNIFFVKKETPLGKKNKRPLENSTFDDFSITFFATCVNKSQRTLSASVNSKQLFIFSEKISNFRPIFYFFSVDVFFS